MRAALSRSVGLPEGREQARRDVGFKDKQTAQLHQLQCVTHLLPLDALFPSSDLNTEKLQDVLHVTFVLQAKDMKEDPCDL